MNVYNHIHIKYIHIYSCIPLSFVKLLFNVLENNNNVKTVKIIKKVIFALFVLGKIKFEEM